MKSDVVLNNQKPLLKRRKSKETNRQSVHRISLKYCNEDLGG